MKRSIDSIHQADFLFKPERVLVVSATAKNNYKETLLYKSLVEQRYPGKFVFHENNKESLCAVYNNYITTDWDYVFYIHDDVYIDSCNFVNIAIQNFINFDICGLAGGSKLKIKKPLLWHLMTDKSTWSGVVSHGTLENYLPTVFGQIGKKVVLLDGLFLAIQPKKLLEKNITFDENLKGFHHYDLKFCVDSFQAGLILGTIPVHVIHNSPGLQNFTSSYKESENYFYKELEKLHVKK